MSTQRARAAPAVEKLRRSLAVAAGDVLAIVAVVSWGLYSHYGAAAFATPAESLSTVLPFVLGWPIPAVLAGVYDDQVIADAIASVRYTAVAWIAAANIGLLLRTSPVFGDSAIWPFGLVITGTVLVVLLGWRALAAWLVGTLD
ncbi:Protein of unknown function [Natronoarchaeum philippinense]|uniref:DUF3054 domain-containing protein n=1 Tax=Natronoarchaeum philippinense TaxID=558529 RepID=A0A285N3F2_NATPI|nr:DUF3054 domain-containing protein [Natronoarchaeum philippinense]SNZ03960.1 Protein of unknown function [Natronoarchaeum philippinense]